LKIPKLQNMKTIFFQNPQEERQIPLLPPCKTSHKWKGPNGKKRWTSNSFNGRQWSYNLECYFWMFGFQYLWQFVNFIYISF
jgi:hypothetical protein